MGRRAARQWMDLGWRERQVLEALVRLRQATAREVMADLADPPGYSAVRAMLARLEGKHLVSSIPDGSRRVYRATGSPDGTRRTALRRVVDGLFEGSLERTLAGLLSAKRPDDSELARLSELIERARRAGK